MKRSLNSQQKFKYFKRIEDSEIITMYEVPEEDQFVEYKDIVFLKDKTIYQYYLKGELEPATEEEALIFKLSNKIRNVIWDPRQYWGNKYLLCKLEGPYHNCILPFHSWNVENKGQGLYFVLSEGDEVFNKYAKYVKLKGGFEEVPLEEYLNCQLTKSRKIINLTHDEFLKYVYEVYKYERW